MPRYVDVEQVEEMLQKLEQEEKAEVFLPSFFNIAILDIVPTANVKEINHGHWTMSADGAAVCSVCKRKMNPHLYGYPYCAKCGAEMGGERNDDK